MPRKGRSQEREKTDPSAQGESRKSKAMAFPSIDAFHIQVVLNV